MLLEDLAEFHSVEEAAEAFAGNWKKWSHFVWWGSKDIPRSENVLLGYLVNHQGGVDQETHLKVVTHKLQPFWGDMREENVHAGSYGADFCGDKNLLSGVMLRVYDHDRSITGAFRTLYETAIFFDENYHYEYEGDVERIYNGVNLTFCNREVETFLLGLHPNTQLDLNLVEKMAGWLAEEDYDEMFADSVLDNKLAEAYKGCK